MQDFDWTKFTQRIVVNAPMGKVYTAGTNCYELEKWFLSQARVKKSADVVEMSDAMQVNDEYAWNWYGYEFT